MRSGAPRRRSAISIIRIVARVLAGALADAGRAVREIGSHEAYMADLFHRGDSAMRGGDQKPETQRRDFTQ